MPLWKFGDAQQKGALSLPASQATAPLENPEEGEMGLVYCEVMEKLVKKLGLPLGDLQEKMKSVYSGRDVRIEFGKLYKLRGGKKQKDLPGVLAIILGVGLSQMDQLLTQLRSENCSLKGDLEQLKNNHHVLQADYQLQKSQMVELRETLAQLKDSVEREEEWQQKHAVQELKIEALKDLVQTSAKNKGRACGECSKVEELRRQIRQQSYQIACLTGSDLDETPDFPFDGKEPFEELSHNLPEASIAVVETRAQTRRRNAQNQQWEEWEQVVTHTPLSGGELKQIVTDLGALSPDPLRWTWRLHQLSLQYNLSDQEIERVILTYPEVRTKWHTYRRHPNPPNPGDRLSVLQGLQNMVQDLMVGTQLRLKAIGDRQGKEDPLEFCHRYLWYQFIARTEPPNNRDEGRTMGDIMQCPWSNQSLKGVLGALQRPERAWIGRVDAAYPLDLATLETDLREARKAVGNVGEESKVKTVGEVRIIKDRWERSGGDSRNRNLWSNQGQRVGNGEERVQVWRKLKDLGENMERWDGAPTRSLKERVEQLQRNQGGKHGSKGEDEGNVKEKEQPFLLFQQELKQLTEALRKVSVLAGRGGYVNWNPEWLKNLAEVRTDIAKALEQADAASRESKITLNQGIKLW